MIRSKTAALLLLALLGVSGPVACKKSLPAAKSETTEEGKEKDEKESADRVKLSPEALESLKLVLATAEETDLSPALEVAAELVPDPDRRAGTVDPHGGKGRRIPCEGRRRARREDARGDRPRVAAESGAQAQARHVRDRPHHRDAGQ